jgi:hypothetical protein
MAHRLTKKRPEMHTPPPPIDTPFAKGGLPHPAIMMIGLIGWLALIAIVTALLIAA